MSPRRRAWLLRGLAGAVAWPRAVSAAGTDAGRPAPSAGSTAIADRPGRPGPPTRPDRTALPSAGGDADDAVRAGRVLRFPRDHGAHPAARTEWWYATGWLGSPDSPRLGWQLTFFRSRTGLAGDDPGRFAPKQLLFAHAAVTDLAAGRHLHDQRIARWSGAADAGAAAAALHDAAVHIGDWWLRRDAGGAWQARLPSRGFSLALRLQPTQALLLQGRNGTSRKGPGERQISHYVSLPQLAAQGRVGIDGAARGADESGRGWIDHEWSDEILADDAVGWDWAGINLFDGGALTVFVLRRRDGTPSWAGGSVRAAGTDTVADFGSAHEPGPSRPAAAAPPAAVRMTPGRRWRSPASGASYPVAWTLQTPAGHHTLRALLDAQELDSRASTGTVYWEGLAELLDGQGRRIGLGYLEMTGYAAPLKL